MFALELGGKEYAWDSLQIIGLFAGFVVLLGSFILMEKYAAEPIVPLIYSKIVYLLQVWVSASLTVRF